jgi:hypothetical protein
VQQKNQAAPGNGAVSQDGSKPKTASTRFALLDPYLGFVMNNPFTVRGIVFALVAVLILLLVAGPSLAATSTDYAQAPVCFAGFFQEVAGNRSKIIQLSIVFVLVGIALLFKK